MKRDTLYEKIYNDILEGISTNKYPVGSLLPSESELSKAYNVSRITSKKALEMLAVRNIIIRKPGKGSYVLENHLKELTEPTETVAILNKNHKERLIGVIMDSFGDSYGYKILLGMEQECKKHGISMVLKCSYGSKEEETKSIDKLLDIGVDGIIIMCVHDDNYNSKVLKLSLDNYPTVLIDRMLKGIPIPYVGTDNYKAAKELTEGLFKVGHQNISYVAPMSVDTSTVEDRHKGFVDCHMEHGLVTNESLWITDLKSTLPSYHTDELAIDDNNKIKDFVLNHPEITAFFAIEYEIAVIIYQSLCQLGLEKEKSIACFDSPKNIADEIMHLTYVEQDEVSIGKNSIRVLEETMDGKKDIEPQLIPYHIIKK
ncbi:MAG: substrate-binding domain-containing protein [Anaerocolumna sp.]